MKCFAILDYIETLDVKQLNKQNFKIFHLELVYCQKTTNKLH